METNEHEENTVIVIGPDGVENSVVVDPSRKTMDFTPLPKHLQEEARALTEALDLMRKNRRAALPLALRPLSSYNCQSPLAKALVSNPLQKHETEGS